MVVDPADAEEIARLCGLLRAGRADLYVQDEADLALLPTLTCTWMLRGEQRNVLAPGTNKKRSVAAATDMGDGGCLWRTDDRRCAAQFGMLTQRCILRSSARRRIAILLVDNAQSHRVGKTGLVRAFLDAWPGRVVLVFLPPCSPDLQPAERLWRRWRPNVTHNHTRSAIEQLVADSDNCLARFAQEPDAIRRALGLLHNSNTTGIAA